VPATARFRMLRRAVTLALSLGVLVGTGLAPAAAAAGSGPTRANPAPSHPPQAAVVSFGDTVLAEAVRHLGAPYVYGAAGPQAFDCSGFVQYVLGRLGVVLPRTSADQYAAVRHVAVADRQVGDLVFFRLGGGGIDHVGIYAGKDQIVVAPKSGDHVRYEKIWTSYSVGRAG
jgi:peptidoglycan DL-endopeptidase CwlO